MDLQSILAALLNPGGTQQAGGPMPMGPGAVGDHNDPRALQQAMMQFQQPQAAPQQAPQAFAPQQAPQQPGMPQSAPQAAPAQRGGGFGDFVTGLFDPQAKNRNVTRGWLEQQGLDPGTATIIASDKGLLRNFIAQRQQGTHPIEIAGKLVDPNTYKVLADFSQPKEREIRNDANGVPRYTDTGEAVYKSDQSASARTQFFAGRSVEAQGLNYLIDQNVLSKEQAANVAAGKSVTGPNGEIIFMTPQGIFQQPAQGGQASPVGPQGSNIPITGPKYSEDMRKAGGFAMRAAAADKIVSTPDISSAGTSTLERGLSSIPVIGNYTVSPQYQQFDQAQRDFINAVLRRESGAAIGADEFDNARMQYLPQPGDGPEVLRQKANNRKLAIESLQQSANPVPSFNAPTSQSAPQPQPAGDDTPPASYEGDPAIWKYMTPEQKKLWQ